MKRFNLLRFVFALACGCHINGVKSQTCSDGKYLNVKGICTDLPYNDKSPVVKAIPEPERCGAFDTTLKVKKYEYTQTLPWFVPKLRRFKDCQGLCRLDRNCTHFEYDENSRNCSYIVKESFGTKEQNIVSGYGECPTTDKCLNFGSDFIPTAHLSYYRNIKGSPMDCQKLCRRKDSPTVFGYRWSEKHHNVVYRDCYCAAARSFDLVPSIDWISGDTRCPPCFFYDIKLRNLRIVTNGGRNPYLKKPTVGDCQRSCEDNPLCTWFEYDRSNEECRHKNIITGEMKKKNVIYGSRYCNCDCNKDGVNGCSNDDVCHCKPGYKGPRCDQCDDESYMPDRNDKICYPCNCDLIGSANRNCDHTGLCTCQQNSWFTGKKCDICENGHNITNNLCCPAGKYLDAPTNNCEACRCDSRGSQDSQCDGTGQCPCHPGNDGKHCSGCLAGKVLSNGRCCPPGHYHSSSQGGCIDCQCNLKGIKKDMPCKNGGDCECNDSYTGKKCKEVKEREITIGSLRNSFGRQIKAIVFKCNGNCEIRGLRITNTNVNVYMEARTGRFTIRNSGWRFYGDHICTGTSTCSYSGILSQNDFHIHLKAFRDYSTAKLKFKIPNYKTSYEQTSYSG